jgi:hypothetical protein
VLKLIRYLRAELLVVLGTASSDSVLPQVMKKLEYMGIRKSVVGLVIPTGYSFNLDAFSIYLTLAAVFIAQATNTPLALGDLLGILAVALVTSKGAHGIPGSAIVILAATLSAHPAIPAIGLVLVLSVDWFIGIARAVGNLIGNCVATVVVAAWERDIDRERAHGVLNGTIPAGELEEGLTVRRMAPGKSRYRRRCRGGLGALESRHPIHAQAWQATRDTMPEHIDPDMTAEAIADDIVAAIVSHRLPPGTKLREEALASVYRVSRTKVRAALLMLSKDKVIQIVPDKGAFVAKPSAEEAREVLPCAASWRRRWRASSSPRPRRPTTSASRSI